jgi:hypothetical protein
MYRSQYRLTEFYQVDPEIAAIAADQTAIDETLESFGFQPYYLTSAWKQYGYGQILKPNGEPDERVLTTEQYTAHSLRNVIELERRLPGSAKQLTEDHGIFSFGRYTVDYLAKLHQLDMKRCGNIVLASCAAGDYNGAMWEGVQALERLDETLDDDTTVVINEFYDNRELSYQWSRYADLGLQVCHFVIAGHGNPKEIETVMHYGGRGSYRGTLKQEHITGDVGELMKKIAAPGAGVLLDSCSIAKGEDNMAQTIFESTGLPTAGPVADVSLMSLRGQWRKGQLHLTPGFYQSYPQGEFAVHRRSPARRYGFGAPTKRNATTISLSDARQLSRIAA